MPNTVRIPIGGVARLLSPILPAIVLIAALAVVLLITSSLGAALVALAGVLFCGFLLFAPPFWLALLLVVLIPFQSLMTQLLGGFDSSGRQVFALWKEILLGVGILRLYLHSPNRKAILSSNRWILVCSGLLLLVYCTTFVRAPSLPGIFSFNLETRFVGVMLFFMLLDLDERRSATLLRVMVWSVGLIAAYGLVQYTWDYGRLLPLVYNIRDIYADDVRRLYSYSLNPLEPAYGGVIAILVLLSGAGRSTLRVAFPLFALLFVCLLLTYTRSAYLGLLVGLIVVGVVNHIDIRRYAVIPIVAVFIVCAVLLFSGPSVFTSNIAQRLQSILSQNDESSEVHKAGMESAVQIISAHPFGIGLGKYGTIEARFSDDDDTTTKKTEDWVLQVAVQNGIIGAFAYIAFIFATLARLLLKKTGRNKHANALRAAAAGGFVAMIVASIMIPVWDLLLPTVYVWALVGMALAVGTRTRRVQTVTGTSEYTLECIKPQFGTTGIPREEK